MCLRVVGIVFSVAIVLITAAVFMVPPIAIKWLTVFERDDSAKFVSFKELFVNADPTCLFVGDIGLSEVRLAGPYASNSFNSGDILQKVTSENLVVGMASPDELISFKGEPVYGLMVDFK